MIVDMKSLDSVAGPSDRLNRAHSFQVKNGMKPAVDPSETLLLLFTVASAVVGLLMMIASMCPR
jgi:hypothetical protein